MNSTEPGTSTPLGARVAAAETAARGRGMTLAERAFAGSGGAAVVPWLVAGATAVLYYLAGWWGVHVAGLPGSALTLVWPASGIAFIAVLHYGRRALLAVFLASMAVHLPPVAPLPAGSPPLVSLVLALAGAGAALEAGVAARLAVRVAGDRIGPGPFLLGMLVAMPVGAALGAVPLVGSDIILRQAEPGGLSALQLWHGVALANYIGMIVIAPPLWLWLHSRPRKMRPGRLLEGCGYLALVVAALALPPPYQPVYLLLIAAIAAVIRLRLKWATLGVAAASIAVLWLTAAGRGPVERATPYATMLATMSFVFALNVVTYLIGLLWRDLERHRRNLQDLVDKRTRELREANAELERLARTDPLTGAWNRRHFNAALRREIERAVRDGSGLALLAIDLDHFKQVNDRHGHETGDEVLKAVVNRWRDALRSIDILGRTGGEEFVVLLVNCEQHEAGVVAERLRRAVEERPVTCGDLSVPITASLGQVCWHPARVSDKSIEEMMATAERLADRRLYAAKQRGRNRVYAGAA